MSNVRGPTVYARLVQRLLQSPGIILDYNDLVEAMWPDPDHQPEDARTAIHVTVFKARRRGWDIRNHNRRGYVLA